MPAYNSGASVFAYPVSPDYRVAALQAGFTNGSYQEWLGLNLTYSFPAGGSFFDQGTSYGKGEVRAGWAPFSAAQQVQVRKALAAWSSVSALTFTEVADGQNVGDLRFAFTSLISGTEVAHAYSPAEGSASAGDVWVRMSEANASFSSGRSISASGASAANAAQAFNYLTLLHEIGHSLGLSHPFAEANATRGTAALPVAQDNYDSTVMSYSNASSNGLYGGSPTTPMPYDILAMQYLYGANFFYNSGSTTYSYDINEVNYETIWDAGGLDTLVVTNNSNVQSLNTSYIDLREGSASGIGFASVAAASYTLNVGSVVNATFRGSGKVYIAYGVTIENVVTTDGNENITGNSANNTVTSGLGNDVIDGGAGIDTSVYSQARSRYLIAKTAAGYTVTDSFTTVAPNGNPFFGTDTLVNVERLKFNDTKVAIDMAGNGGATAKILGAVFGKAAVANKEYVGIGLSLLDGGMSYANLAQLAINAKLGAGAGSAAVVTLLYTNLVGSAPGAADLAYYKGLLDSGSLSVANLGVIAAEHPLNAVNINLVGLATTGLEFN